MKGGVENKIKTIILVKPIQINKRHICPVHILGIITIMIEPVIAVEVLGGHVHTGGHPPTQWGNRLGTKLSLSSP